MVIEAANCIVRTPAPSDAPSLAKHANNRRVWLNLRDQFPHPYALEHAQAWIGRVLTEQPPASFVVVVDDEAVGGVGLTLHSDIERISAEIGYWLGEPVWGRGIGTAAVRAVTDYALGSLGLVRVYALPFAGNSASRRLLEKAGFACEGILKRAVIKDGVVLDQALYARVAS